MAELDPRQRAAVDAGPVDLLIAAGAGSGKTRVLSTRFVSAVLGMPPYEPTDSSRLLAVTFTEKAAGELTERIRGALVAAGNPAAARSMGEAWISTIHGMCSRILRRHALDAGIDPHFTVMNDVEASALESAALEEALRACLPDERFSHLLDAYSLDTLVDSARRVRSSVHALGMHVADVCTVPVHEALADIEQAARELTGLAEEFETLRPLKTVEMNKSVVRGLAQGLSTWDLAQRAEALAALDSISSSKLRRVSSVEGHDELVEAARMQVERAHSAVAQTLVAQLEQAFIQFAQSFEQQYATLKSVRSALDFEDLQVRTAMLLEDRPELAGRYRDQFAMVMLDESQDTNALQLRIIEHLSHENLCTVGDENQSIYAFRHADVEVFRTRASTVTCKEALDINYRTAPSLLAAINGLFSHAALLGPRFMQLSPPENSAEQPTVEPRFAVRLVDGATAKGEDSHEVEAAQIAQRVEELLDEGVEPGQVAVLMRSLSGGRAAKVEASLLGRDIPVYITSGGSFFGQPEIAEARALLSTIANVWDDAALAVVLAGRLTSLHPDSLIVLRAHADALAESSGRGRREVHLWEAATDGGLKLDAVDAAALARTVAAVERARERRGTRSLSETVLDPLLELDADLVLFASGRGGARAWANILKLARIASEFETVTGGDLGGLLNYLDLRERHATSEQEATLDGESDAVRVMSIHAAKGLEFPHVIVSGLTGAQDTSTIALGMLGGKPTLGMKYACPAGAVATMGSSRVRQAGATASAAEAVRLLYVACTRAEESLTLVGRTDPGKEAGSTLIDLVRSALGFAEAGSVASGEVQLGDGLALVNLVSATQAEASDQPLERGETGTSLPTTSPAEAAPATVPVMQARQPEPLRFRLPTVSYSGLATYQRCPYRFYLTSVIRLPAPPAARGGEALAFGTAVHAVLERMTSCGGNLERWIERASASAGLDDAGRARLRNAVETYRGSDVAREVFCAEQVTHEMPITVPIGDTVLVGAIDVLARGGDEVLIVDYKTGTGELDQEEAEERYRLQGECYALAAFSTGARRVKVVFAEIERGREIRFKYDDQDAPGVAAHVGEIVSKIAEGEFSGRREYNPQLCETCPGLGGLCPVRRPSRSGAA